MNVTKRMITGLAVAVVGIMGPAGAAVAAAAPGETAVADGVLARQHGPHVTAQDCEMWRTELYMQGYRVWPCEQHPISGKWWFLYE